MRKTLTLLLLILSLTAGGTTYYISTTGNNANAGSLASPWATWQKGFSSIVAGDTLYIRGGTYSPTETVFSGYDNGAYVYNVDGSAGNLIVVLNYPGETPIMDATNVDGASAYTVGLHLWSCDYWYIKGLTIQYSLGFGMELQSCTNITVDQCVFRYNIGSGFRVFSNSDDVLVLNCDAHHNQNELEPGSPDGFEASDIPYRVGDLRLVTFRGCRAWSNSDDGFDNWMMEGYLVIDGCWAWDNGWTDGDLTGDGDGFKLGTTTTDMSAMFSRTITNCVAFSNRLWGFSQNGANTKFIFKNNTSVLNYGGYNFWFYDYADTIANNISTLNSADEWNGTYNNRILYTNSYDHKLPLGPVANAADFITMDTTGVSGPRQANGSLPLLTILHLITGSDLIGAGTDVNLESDADGKLWNTPPSIGAYEYKVFPYYVSSSSGSDSNTGRTQTQAWASMAKVSASSFSPGDSILFKRGDTFRGYLLFPSNGSAGNHIVIDAYGTGAKPKLLGSKDLSSAGDWTLHAGNVWKTTVKLGTYNYGPQNWDVGSLFFNGDTKAGWRVFTLAEVNGTDRFFYNIADSMVYLYSTVNPASAYSNIDCGGVYAEVTVKFRENRHHVTIRNIDARHSGNNCIYIDGANNITVEYCDVSWLGGWVYTLTPRVIRMGNGIGAWIYGAYVYDIIIRNNKVWQAYDAGISPQGPANTAYNIQMYNNIIYDCYYSYETWVTSDQTNTNINFFNNTCYNAGGQWSLGQRPDKTNAAHVMIWDLGGTVNNCSITNNIFVNSTNWAYRIDDNWTKLNLDYNIVIADTVWYTEYYNHKLTLAEWQTFSGLDAHSIDDDPAFLSISDFRLQSGSPAIDAGMNTGLTTDYAGNSRPVNGIYDIGAYEYSSSPEPPPVTGSVLGKSSSDKLLVDKNGNLININN